MEYLRDIEGIYKQLPKNSTNNLWIMSYTNIKIMISYLFSPMLLTLEGI